MKNFPIENRIYKSIVSHCEVIQNNGQYMGNGHHLAQRLTSMVSIGLLSKQQSKIYESLTDSTEGMSVKELSLKTKISSRAVASQLIQIYKKTQLLSFKKNGKNKLWFKYKILN